MGIKIVNGAFHTSPTISLYAESSELPPEYKRKLMLMKYSVKVLANPNHINFSSLKQPPLLLLYEQKPKLPKPYNVRFNILSLSYNCNTADIIQMSERSSTPWEFDTCIIDTSLSEQTKASTNTEVYKTSHYKTMEKHKRSLKIYTDGSKSTSGTACAYYSTLQSKSFKLNNNCSIFTAELKAIYVALTFARNHNSSSIVLISDSLSALNAIKNIYTPNFIIQDIQHLIIQMINDNKTILLHWAPSHIGIRGNEEADKMAKEATTKNTIDDTSAIFSDVYNVVKHDVWNDFNHFWESIQNNKLRNNKPTIWRYSYPALRRDQVILTRILIGHTKFTHKYLLNRENPPVCANCNEIISVHHILYTCPLYESARQQSQLRSIHNPLENTLPNCINIIMSFIQKLPIVNEL